MKSLIAPFNAYKGKDPYVFVSYAHKNSEVVFKHISRLRDKGFRIWYDEGIDPGTDWSDEIAFALDNASSFLVFISPESVDSHNVKKEIVFALSRKKHMICVHIAETELPLGLQMQLGNIQAILEERFNEKEKFFARLFDALPKETCASQTEQESTPLADADSLEHVWAAPKDSTKASPVLPNAAGQGQNKPKQIINPSFEVTHSPLGSDDFYCPADGTVGRDDFIHYEDWLYFSAVNEMEHGIYRLRPNGNDLQFIDKENYGSFAISQEYIFYTNGNTLHAINHDGSGLHKVNGLDTEYFAITQNQIFQSASAKGGWNSRDKYLVCSEPDGYEVYKKRVCAAYMQVDEPYIFFHNRESDKGISRLTTDGEEYIEDFLNEDVSSIILDRAQKHIYFGDRDDYFLWEIDYDGNNLRKTKVKTGSFSPVNQFISDGYFYYSNSGNSQNVGFSIGRFNIKNGDRESLMRSDELACTNLKVYGNWIYFRVKKNFNEYDNDLYLCRLRIDGSTFETIFKYPRSI